MSEVYFLLELEIRSGQSEAFEALMNELVASSRDEPGTLNYEWNTDADRTLSIQSVTGTSRTRTAPSGPHNKAPTSRPQDSRS